MTNPNCKRCLPLLWADHLRKIRELETELARNKEESELRLRALRQQHERLKIGMEKRLEATKRSGREGVGGGFGLRAARAGVGGSTGFTQRAKSRGEGSGVHKYNEQQQQSPQPKQQVRCPHLGVKNCCSASRT